MEPTQGSKKFTGIIIGAVVVFGIAIMSFLGVKKAPVVEQQKNDDEVPTESASVSQPVVTSNATSSEFKDGTYTADGTYMSPGGRDNLTLTLSIKDGVVTSSSLKTMPGDDTSEKFMNTFAENYTQYVVGQNLSSLSLSKVSRSSLTSIGFNDAVSKIKTQAKI